MEPLVQMTAGIDVAGAHVKGVSRAHPVVVYHLLVGRGHHGRPDHRRAPIGMGLREQRANASDDRAGHGSALDRGKIFTRKIIVFVGSG